ncbi:MAG: hypothetical protein IJI14_09805 [Anaerolineaceae bacterium]|nr:hypothetical protein [Anaerolineaceae bacterium]
MLIWNKYKRKSDIIEAFVYKGGYVHGIVTEDNGISMVSMSTGDIPVKKGDYVLKSGKGEYSVVSAAEFERDYVPVISSENDIPDCPCCGSSASVVKKETENGSSVLYYVRCSNKDCRVRTKNCGSKTEALQIWSKRV